MAEFGIMAKKLKEEFNRGGTKLGPKWDHFRVK